MKGDQSSTSVSPLALTGAIAGILVLILSIIYLFFRSPSSSESDEIKSENRIKPENNEKKQPTKSTTSKTVKQDPKVANKFVHPWLCASLRAHSSSINGLDFSHNDKFLASAAEGNFVIFILRFFYCRYI
jgi:hypothetical protein